MSATSRYLTRSFLGDEFFSVTRSKHELSVVTSLANLPSWEANGARWHVFKVYGPFAFTEIGVLASLAALLTKDGVGIFVISTFDTDYLLVQIEQTERVIASLQTAGHTIWDIESLKEEMKESRG